MRHYFNPMSRAVTSDWMLKELDVAHERIVIDIQAGEQDSPEYRATNPMGKVPTLVDGDAVVTEAAAICAYLADKFAEKGLAPSPSSPERGRYYRYLFFPLPPSSRFCPSLRLESRTSGPRRWGGVTCRVPWPRSRR